MRMRWMLLALIAGCSMAPRTPVDGSKSAALPDSAVPDSTVPDSAVPDNAVPHGSDSNGTDSGSAGSPVTALTFNIRYGTADDGPDAWPLRREGVAALLVGTGADLIGLQEALDFQLEYLDRVLVNHARVGQGREGGTRGEHTALYFDTRRFELVEAADRWLSETPEVVGSVGWDAALTRLCTHALLRERATRREFVVWNTHWDHRGERARLESARLIADWVRACDAPSIVLGDFNAEESSAPLELLRAAGLRDSFRDLHPDAREVGTYHAFRGGKSGPKIDYCLVTRQWRSLGAGLLDQRGAHGRWPSDHHGVWAVLEQVD